MVRTFSVVLEYVVKAYCVVEVEAETEAEACRVAWDQDHAEGNAVFDLDYEGSSITYVSGVAGEGDQSQRFDNAMLGFGEIPDDLSEERALHDWLGASMVDQLTDITEGTGDYAGEDFDHG